MQTWVDHAKFNSFQDIAYTNHTEDNLYVYDTRLWVDVWQNGDGGAGLVCSGNEVTFERGRWGQSNTFSFTVTRELSPYSSWVYWNSAFNKEIPEDIGQFNSYNKTAEAEVYTILGQPVDTCAAADDGVPVGPWFDGMPGWQSYTTEGSTEWFHIAFECEDIVWIS